MANDTRRISQLTQTTVLNPTDRVLVLSNPNTTPNVQTISFASFANAMAANAALLLPYANTTKAGIVKTDGVTITSAANGVLSVNPSVVMLPNSSYTITAPQNFSGLISVSGNTLNLGSSVIASNGYSYLPNGLKMNWGTFVCNTTSSVTFSSPFSNSVLSIAITPIGQYYLNANAPYVYASNTMTANIYSASTTTTNKVYYVAIGY